MGAGFFQVVVVVFVTNVFEHSGSGTSVVTLTPLSTLVVDFTAPPTKSLVLTITYFVSLTLLCSASSGSVLIVTVFSVTDTGVFLAGPDTSTFMSTVAESRPLVSPMVISLSTVTSFSDAASLW